MTDIREKSNIVKAVSAITNNVGCSAIVSNIITSTTPASINILTALCIKGAGICLGSALGDFTNAYASKKIDEIVDAYESGHFLRTLLGLGKPEEEEIEEVPLENAETV